MRANVDKPFTWVKYRKGLCDGCWAGCCTMPVEVKDSDLVRLGLTSEEELEESPKKVATKLQRQGIVRSYRASTGLFMFERRHGRDCYFLGADRLCTVYDRRPDVCRRFPDVGPRPGFCPSGKKDL